MFSPQGFYGFIHYLFVMSLLCSRLLLFVTSLCFLLMVSIVSLSVCYVSALFKASTVSSSVCFVIIIYAFYSWFPLFHYLFVTSVLCSRFRLSLLLFATSLCSLLMVSIIVSLSVCYVTMLSFQGFLCFIICLLRLSLPLFVTSLFIQAITVAPLQANYYSEALQTQYTDVLEFDAEAPQATASEGLAQGPYVAAKTGLKHTTFQTKGVQSNNEPPCLTIISLQGCHYFIICLLRHCSVLGFDCLLRCSFRHYTISSSKACFDMH